MQNSGHSFEDTVYEQLVQEGIAAVKAKQRQQARYLLNRATDYHRPDARPWIWLAATYDNPQEQRHYLECAVAAEPSNAAARRALLMLSEKLDKSRLLKEGQGLQPVPAPEPQPAQGESFTCPQCGGRLRFDPKQSSLLCESCASAQPVEVQIGTEANEQAMDYVLPTTRGHRWAVAQQAASCQGCGAVVLLPPGQKSAQCPYCGSNQLVASPESIELVEPQAIGLFQVDAEGAKQAVRTWLGKGWLSPDDLSKGVNQLHLRPAYYPFWTFDGTLEIHWSCEVNEGTSRQPVWVYRSGTEAELFDDVLSPGFQGLAEDLIGKVKPFALKQLAVFKPEFLAGWLALGYNRSLADASLLAREQVIRSLRSAVDDRVLPGRSKRNLSLGAGEWSGMAYKHVLLPLWSGSYTYKGKTYPLLVNGQTGKVAGDKPHDDLKIVLYIAIAVIVLAVIGVIVLMLLGR